jgi:hypothetical protein
MFGGLSLVGVALGARRGLFGWRERRVIFAAAFALAPFVVFNQQIITGRSLQPFHYSMFSANYVAVLASVLCAALLWRGRQNAPRRIPSRVLIICAALAFSSGAAETFLAGRRYMQGNVFRDEAAPAAHRLAALARNPPDGQPDTRSVVFATHITIADNLPEVAPQPVLWSPHMFNFPGVTLAEDRERLLQYLYYAGVSFADVDAGKFDQLDNRRRWYLASLVRRARLNPHLTIDWQPLTPAEVRGALQTYNAHVAAFDRTRAAQPLLSFVLTSAQEQVDFSHLDRWYERDAGERAGQFTLYRVRLRP